MKIAIASDLFWPMINGISVFSKNLAEQMVKRGHEVVVFAPSQNGDYYVEELSEGYRVVRLSSVNFPFYPNQTEPLAPPRKIAGRITMPRVYLNNGYKLSLLPYREIRRFCRQNNFMPDVAHIQLQLMVGQAMIDFSRKNHIPVVITNHASPENLFDNLKLLAGFNQKYKFDFRLAIFAILIWIFEAIFAISNGENLPISNILFAILLARIFLKSLAKTKKIEPLILPIFLAAIALNSLFSPIIDYGTLPILFALAGFLAAKKSKFAGIFLAAVFVIHFFGSVANFNFSNNFSQILVAIFIFEFAIFRILAHKNLELKTHAILDKITLTISNRALEIYAAHIVIFTLIARI